MLLVGGSPLLPPDMGGLPTFVDVFASDRYCWAYAFGIKTDAVKRERITTIEKYVLPFKAAGAVTIYQ